MRKLRWAPRCHGRSEQEGTVSQQEKKGARQPTRALLRHPPARCSGSLTSSLLILAARARAEAGWANTCSGSFSSSLLIFLPFEAIALPSPMRRHRRSRWGPTPILGLYLTLNPIWVQMDDHVHFSGTKYAKGNNTLNGIRLGDLKNKRR